MSRVAVGLIAGLIFGAVDVALMLPMSFPDKRTALVAAFLSRFGIGLVIPLVNLPSRNKLLRNLKPCVSGEDARFSDGRWLPREPTATRSKFQAPVTLFTSLAEGSRGVDF
jgi:hypothetical protein